MSQRRFMSHLQQNVASLPLNVAKSSAVKVAMVTLNAERFSLAVKCCNTIV
jgi:hypothetical protein